MSAWHSGGPHSGAAHLSGTVCEPASVTRWTLSLPSCSVGPSEEKTWHEQFCQNAVQALTRRDRASGTQGGDKRLTWQEGAFKA